MALKFHRIHEVSGITGLKPSTIYKHVRLGLFPRGIKLTKRSTGWSSEQIDDWLRAKVNEGSKI